MLPTGYPWVHSKMFSQFGSAVWPAIANIYTNLALLYRRYIHFFQSLKKVYSVNFLSLLYGMSLREKNPINLLKFCSCSRRFNGADVRTVHSRKFICWVHCVHSLKGIIILLQQLHLLYLIFQDWFLYSTLIIVVFLNVCTAIFQGGIIGKKGTDTYLIDLYVLLTHCTVYTQHSDTNSDVNSVDLFLGRFCISLL